MKLLALDTSTLTAGVAVLVDGRLAAERRARVTTHSERLLTIVDEVMREASLVADQLDAVACGAGPGSFTGLRIGLATAKGLCWATHKPLLLVSSLATLAARAPDGTRVCAVLDAYKSEVYAGVYDVVQGEPRVVVDEAVLPPARLVETLAPLGPLVLVGEGVQRYLELLAGRSLLDDDPAPRPGDLALLAARRLARGEHDHLADAGPRYLRPSEAELARDKRQT